MLHGTETEMGPRKMSLQDPFTDLKIERQDSGFYKGYNLPIALVSKIAVSLLVLWALVWPLNANDTLRSWKSGLLSEFNVFYNLSVALFAFFLFVVAILPATGRMRLGGDDERPEFTNFSWFSMMFGAGLGVGLMVYATAEPLGLWESNPLTMSGEVASKSSEAIQGGYRYTFLHTGFHAWAIYVVTGLSLAYYAYTRDMPLTIRTALTPLLGEYSNGVAGHVIDILGVVATILGVAVTIGYGVSQLVDGAFLITSAQWLMEGVMKPSTAGLIAALALVMMMSTLYDVDPFGGVRRGARGEIPFEPQSDPVADPTGGVHFLWLVFICDQNLWAGIGGLYRQFHTTQLASPFPDVPIRVCCSPATRSGPLRGRAFPRCDRRLGYP